MNLQEEREKSRRYELAKMFAVELLRAEVNRPPIERGNELELLLAKTSVSLADALIATLKEDAK